MEGKDNAPALRDDSGFDLDRCMNQDGGKCLAGDRPARIVCTDAKRGCDIIPRPLVVLVDHEDREVVELYTARGASDTLAMDLRNLPEYQEAEITLWEADNGRPVVTTGSERPAFARPYGPPVTVRFPKS